MPTPPRYILVSLPRRIFDSNSEEDALSSVRSVVSSDSGTVLPFQIPEFKIGSLDGLISQAEDLAKLGGGCEGVISRVSDALRGALDGDDDKIAQNKLVNDSERSAAA